MPTSQLRTERTAPMGHAVKLCEVDWRCEMPVLASDEPRRAFRPSPGLPPKHRDDCICPLCRPKVAS